jgi:Lhr-like helicase
MNMLFAIDVETEEVIVSESPKGSNKIVLVERIGRQKNETLWLAVATLTSITKAEKMDAAVFKAMDKTCQLIYSKYKEGR